MTQPQRVQLRDFVVEHFSREEIFTFCSDYFRDFYEDNEGSSITKSALVRDLVDYCEQRGLMESLKVNLQQTREGLYLEKFERVSIIEVKAQPRNPKQVFLSHAHEDVDIAKRLAKDLRAVGWTVWMTPDSIQPGEQWVNAIDRGLAESGVFIVVLTPNSVRSTWVQSEVQWAVKAARDGLVRLFPLLLKACDISQLSNLLTLSQYLDLERDYMQGMITLRQALAAQPTSEQTVASINSLPPAQPSAQVTFESIKVFFQQQAAKREQEQIKRAAKEEAELRVENERLRQAELRLRLKRENEELKRGVVNRPNQKLQADTYQTPKKSSPSFLLWFIGIAILLCFVLYIANPKIFALPPSVPPSRNLATSTVIAVAQVATTLLTPAPTNTSAPKATIAALPDGLPKTFTLDSPVKVDFILIPAGSFLMGSDKAKDSQAYDDELPQHSLTLGDYYIGKYKVTNAQFGAFVQARGYKTTAEKEGSGFILTGTEWKKIKGADWRHPRGPDSNIDDKAQHPVTQISWHDAIAFCEWLSRESGRKVTLPSEAEWEKAARGADGRIYPWGNDAPTNDLLNFSQNISDTTPVGQYSPKGDSSYGAADVAGNVWEWTRSLWGKDVNTPEFKYPYVASDGREDLNASDDVLRVGRGGAWFNSDQVIRVAVRRRSTASFRDYSQGFRVVLSAPN